MKKKQINTGSKLLSILPLVGILLLWQVLSAVGAVPTYMLPSPVQVARALVGDFPLLVSSTLLTLAEALVGLLLGVVAAVLLAVLMDRSRVLLQLISPLLLITQTIPAVALAPLLILWFGYGVLPKIILIFLTCFFPITMGILGGFSQGDPDAIRLVQSMGATTGQIYRHIKFPGALPSFFASLKVSTSYAFVGAVIAEWLGGDQGLGVYMTRVKSAYSYDKMFAVIAVIIGISLLLMKGVEQLQKIATPWEQEK